MARDTVLVTGGNSGIGLECASALARAGWHVVIASRDRAASEEARRRIAGESGADAIDAMVLDLGSLDSVRAFAADVARRDWRLRALVLNAGLQVTQGLRKSAEGHELTFAVNHLGHFLLTNLLLDQLVANAPARIVVVASGVHDPKQWTGMPKPAIDDLATLAATGGATPGAYDGRLAYVNSKLCNLWFAYELVRRLDAAGISRITVNGYDPGLVPGSGLARDYPAPLKFVWNRILPALARVVTLVVPMVNPAPKSGKALADLVTSPGLANVTGKYFPSHTRWHEAASSDASYEVGRAQALWEASVGMTHLGAGESPLVGSAPAAQA